MNDNQKGEKPIDAVDEFLSRYKKSIRRTEKVRTYHPNTEKNKGMKTVTETNTPTEHLDRTREIDPRATFNPVTQRHIVSKKIRTPEDDEDDIKQFSYAERFENQPELPVENINDDKTRSFNTADFSESDNFPGQQSFFDFGNVAVEGKKSIIVNNTQESEVEEEIDNSWDTVNLNLLQADDINSLFNDLSKEHKFEIGKSEKLRAIARTASDDEDRSMGNQLSFPGFESEKSDTIDEKTVEKNLKKTRRDIISAFMNKGGVKKETEEKIEYDSVLDKNRNENKKKKNEAFSNFQKEMTDFIDTHQHGGIQPEVEYTDDNNVSNVEAYISKMKKKMLMRTGIIGIPTAVLLIISVVFSSSVKSGNIISTGKVNFFAFVCSAFLIITAVFFFRDFSHWIKQLKNKKFSSYFTIGLMLLSGFIQNVILFFSPEKINQVGLLFVPAVMFIVLPLYIGRYIIYNNLKLCFSLYSTDEVHYVLKSFGDNGLAEELLSGLKNSGGDNVKYSAKTRFVSGFVKCAVNAVPEGPYVDMFSFLFMFISIASGIITGIVKHSVFTGISVVTGSVILFVPTSYVLISSLLLFIENKKLFKRKTVLPSYSVARDVSHSTAVILDASEITEQNSCSIHGMQTFGDADPYKATQYAASVAIKAKSPLEGIFGKMIAESDMEILETEQLVYEERLGVSTWIENKRVLFGSLDFMRHHNIALPEGNDPELGNRKTVFLAVDDKLRAMFVVSYHIKRSVSAFLRNTVKHGMSILINTVDPNITEKFIEEKCKLPEHSVKVIGVRIGEYFRQVNENVEVSVPVSAITDGKITSLAKMFSASFKLHEIRRITAIISYIGSAMGILLVMILGLVGGLGVLGSLQLIIFRLFWILLAFIASFFIKSEV